MPLATKSGFKMPENPRAQHRYLYITEGGRYIYPEDLKKAAKAKNANANQKTNARNTIQTMTVTGSKSKYTSRGNQFNSSFSSGKQVGNHPNDSVMDVGDSRSDGKTWEETRGPKPWYQSIVDMGNDLMKSVSSGFDSMKKGISGALADIKEFGTNFVDNTLKPAWNKASETFTKATEKVSEIFNSAREGVENLWKNVTGEAQKERFREAEREKQQAEARRDFGFKAAQDADNAEGRAKALDVYNKAVKDLDAINHEYDVAKSEYENHPVKRVMDAVHNVGGAVKRTGEAIAKGADDAWKAAKRIFGNDIPEYIQNAYDQASKGISNGFEWMVNGLTSMFGFGRQVKNGPKAQPSNPNLNTTSGSTNKFETKSANPNLNTDFGTVNSLNHGQPLPSFSDINWGFFDGKLTRNDWLVTA